MASVMAVNTPSFTCAAMFGDRILRITDGYLTSFNIEYPPPIEITSHSFGGFKGYMQPPFRDPNVTIQVRAKEGGLVFELYTQPKISHKLVKDCSIEELLFAIQTKIKKV